MHYAIIAAPSGEYWRLPADLQRWLARAECLAQGWHDQTQLTAYRSTEAPPHSPAAYATTEPVRGTVVEDSQGLCFPVGDGHPPVRITGAAGEKSAALLAGLFWAMRAKGRGAP